MSQGLLRASLLSRAYRPVIVLLCLSFPPVRQCPALVFQFVSSFHMLSFGPAWRGISGTLLWGALACLDFCGWTVAVSSLFPPCRSQGWRGGIRGGETEIGWPSWVYLYFCFHFCLFFFLNLIPVTRSNLAELSHPVTSVPVCVLAPGHWFSFCTGSSSWREGETLGTAAQLLSFLLAGLVLLYKFSIGIAVVCQPSRENTTRTGELASATMKLPRQKNGSWLRY